ncbi:hypothetical protein NL676_036440 [Syzygium grande]|nr:hypothetical protein NL676_036440 [Syzygium grande]
MSLHPCRGPFPSPGQPPFVITKGGTSLASDLGSPHAQNRPLNSSLCCDGIGVGRSIYVRVKLLGAVQPSSRAIGRAPICSRSPQAPETVARCLAVRRGGPAAPWTQILGGEDPAALVENPIRVCPSRGSTPHEAPVAHGDPLSCSRFSWISTSTLRGSHY